MNTKAKKVKRKQSAYCEEPLHPSHPRGMVALRVRKITEEVVLVSEDEFQALERLYNGPFDPEEDTNKYTEDELQERFDKWEIECARADRTYFHSTMSDVEGKKIGYCDIRYPGLLEVLYGEGEYLLRR